MTMRRRIARIEELVDGQQTQNRVEDLRRLTDEELEARISAHELAIAAAGGIDAYFGPDIDLADRCRALAQRHTDWLARRLAREGRA